MFVMVPSVDRAFTDVIIVIVFAPVLDHGPSERYVDPATVFLILACALGYRVEPVGLCLASHENHVAAAKWELQRFRACYCCRVFCAMTVLRWSWLVLQDKIPSGTKREGGNGWIWAQETFVVAVECYAVGPRGVVVDEAEVELAARGRLGGPAEVIQAFGDGPRRIPVVPRVGYFDA